MATTEHTINDALAGVLRGTRRAWQQSNVVRSENTGMLKGSSERPDILVTESTVSPVVIETEVLPAATVESEAISRLWETDTCYGEDNIIIYCRALALETENEAGIIFTERVRKCE